MGSFSPGPMGGRLWPGDCSSTANDGERALVLLATLRTELTYFDTLATFYSSSHRFLFSNLCANGSVYTGCIWFLYAVYSVSIHNISISETNENGPLCLARQKNVQHWMGHPSFHLITHDVVEPIKVLYLSYITGYRCCSVWMKELFYEQEA